MPTRDTKSFDFVDPPGGMAAAFGGHVTTRQPFPSAAIEDYGNFATNGRRAKGHGRVLVIATRFPPSPAVGAIRIRKFVKFLREFGWEPTVVTGPVERGDSISRAFRLDHDFGGLTDLPLDQEIVRVPAWCDRWPGVVSRRIANGIHRITGCDVRSTRAGLEWRLQRLFNQLSFPDRNIWRIGAAISRILDLHRRHRFDAIFSSGMPFSDHVVALVAQGLIRVPWIADFRDPWAEYIHGAKSVGAFEQRMTSGAEAAVLRRATRVISVNDAMTRRFQTRYPGIRSQRFVTVENGFDPDDFAGADAQQARGEFRLFHAGSFYGRRNPNTLLAAFKRFVERTPGSASRAKLSFAGRLGEHADSIQSAMPGDSVRVLGMLPHRAAARATAAADVNVVILPNVPGGELDSTAKIYECLGSGRPLLAMVPGSGAAAQLLAGFDGVWRCDPDDVESTATAIGDLYRRWLMGTLPSRPMTDALEAITRRSQTRRLAELLNTVTRARRSSIESRIAGVPGGIDR